MRTVTSLLEATAAAYPDRIAIVSGEHRLTYAQVDAAADRVAGLLVARGIRPGDRVALSCPNLPYFPIVYYGILKAGGTVVPLNILLKAGEIAYHLADSGAKAYCCFEGTAELPIGADGHAGFVQTEGCEHFFLLTADPAAPPAVDGVETLDQALAGVDGARAAVPVGEDDIAVILYTSGTTGRPKGAELRHRNIRDNALVSGQLFAADPERPDRFLCVLPLFHSFGQTVIQNNAFATGGTVVMLPRFEPKTALTLMLKEQVTVFAGVPTMYWSLLGALDGTVDVAALAAGLRVAISGGSGLPTEIHRNFEKQFGITILEGYGLSETSPIASFHPWGEPARPGSIGTPIPGVEMKLLKPDTWDELDPAPDAIGEIAIKGHNVMKGYHNRPDATAEVLRDGWFRTGDLARRDDDGWYHIVDRSKDMIIRGGFNVYPSEVEQVLMTHPEVSLAAVVGVPDERHGEEIKVYVIPADGATVTADQLIAWAKEHMAAYKYPRSVTFVETLPMTATGKILKRELS
ncbi:long-chain-fatty-acid--CoA ligase [Dactylosporangium sp. CA-092794]|uniref:long-chain-fatty-acid--CoA ligase n=1 Tax=Dactylosporangium sp. CA-092794 TaxID=3239929 RepID=UPI003D8A6D14